MADVHVLFSDHASCIRDMRVVFDAVPQVGPLCVVATEDELAGFLAEHTVALLFVDGDGERIRSLRERWPETALLAVQAEPDAAAHRRFLEAGACETFVPVRDGHQLMRFIELVKTRLSIESRLEDSRLDMQTLFELSSDALLVLDKATGRILRANARAEQLYGYTEEELKGLSFDELRAAPIAGTPVDERRDVVHGRETVRRLEWHITHLGEVRYVECRLQHPRSGGLTSGVIVHDLTDIVQQRDELFFLEQFNNLIFDNLPFGLTIKTREGRISYQNQVAAATFGHLVGGTLADALSGEDYAALAPLDAAAHDQHTRVEITWHGRHYAVMVMPIRDERAKIDLRLELVQDVTEAKDVQQELVRAQRMEAVGNLAGGIAHDFNNLLSGITGYANLIQAVDEENEQVVQYCQVIEQTCTRASELTQELLQFARRRAVVHERFDLNTIVRYASKLLRHSLKKEIKFNQRSCPNELFMQGDPAQVQQMLLNLCFSANEALNSGQIILTTRREHVAEENAPAKNMASGDYVVAMMQVLGGVIDRDGLTSILDPLFLGREPGREANKPMDLRLSVADAIAHRHGGHIVTASHGDSEAVLTIYLPADNPPPPKAADENDALLRGSETVLVIDDEEVLRNLMLTSLARFGYRVLVAATGEDGLALYSAFRQEIHVVLLDIGLPGMDGTRVFSALREMDPHANIILFTGNENDNRLAALLERGARAAINKPISLKKLTQVIRESLSVPNA